MRHVHLLAVRLAMVIAKPESLPPPSCHPERSLRPKDLARASRSNAVREPTRGVDTIVEPTRRFISAVASSRGSNAFRGNSWQTQTNSGSKAKRTGGDGC